VRRFLLSRPGVPVIVLTMDLCSRYRNMCRFNSGVRSTFHVIPPVLTKPHSSSIAIHYYNNFDTTGASSACSRFRTNHLRLASDPVQVRTYITIVTSTSTLLSTCTRTTGHTVCFPLCIICRTHLTQLDRNSRVHYHVVRIRTYNRVSMVRCARYFTPACLFTKVD
jgi:hypothetical protein